MSLTRTKATFAFKVTTLPFLAPRAPILQLRLLFLIRLKAQQTLDLLHFASRLLYTIPHPHPCLRPDNCTTKNHGTLKLASLCGMTMLHLILLVLHPLQNHSRNTYTKCPFARMILHLESRFVEGRGRPVCWPSRPQGVGRAKAPILLEDVQNLLPSTLALTRGVPSPPTSPPGPVLVVSIQGPLSPSRPDLLRARLGRKLGLYPSPALSRGRDQHLGANPARDRGLQRRRKSGRNGKVPYMRPKRSRMGPRPRIWMPSCWR